jgi:hypothetical protein
MLSLALMNSDLWVMPFVGPAFLASIVPNPGMGITMRFRLLKPEDSAKTAKTSPRIWIFYENLNAVRNASVTAKRVRK